MIHSRKRPRSPCLVFISALALLTVGAGASYAAEWLNSQVASGETGSPRIAVSSDTIAISYYKSSSQDLRLARLESGDTDWSFETIASTGSVGSSHSIAVDDSGRFSVAYSAADSMLLKFAYRSGGSWVLQTIGSISSGSPVIDLAYDSSGKPHVAYSYGSSIYYAYRSGGPGTSWTIESSILTSAYRPRLAIDSSDVAHITYSDASYDLKLATRTGANSWSSETIDASTAYINTGEFVFDSNDKVHVVYFGASAYYLHYATNSSGSWADTALVTSKNVERVEIAIDEDDVLHVGYVDSDNNDLFYARKDSSGWSYQTVENMSGTSHVPFIHVGVGCGLPVMTYEDLSSTKIRFADRSDALAVTDLDVTETGRYGLQIGWTGPDTDTDQGDAVAFEVRRSTNTITAANFSSATLVDVVEAGDPEDTYCVDDDGLSTCTTYHYAIATHYGCPGATVFGNDTSDMTDCSGFVITDCLGGGLGAREVLQPSIGLTFARPYPNPAGRSVTFAFEIPPELGDHGIELEVFDLAGRLVNRIARDPGGAGRFAIDWDLRSAGSHTVKNGLYFARLRVGEAQKTRTVFVRR